MSPAEALARANGPWAPFSCLGHMGRTFFKCARNNTLSGETEFAQNASGYELLFERESDALAECGRLNAAPVRIFGAFNTGRLYTVNGQRIAWTVLRPGYVAMYDLDRMIDYVLLMPFAHPTDADVLTAYDTHGAYLGHDKRRNNVAPWNAALYREASDLQSQLIAAARLVAPVRAAGR